MKILPFYCLLLPILFLTTSVFGQIEVDTVLAQEHVYMGDTLRELGKYDSSIFHFEKASEVYQRVENWNKVVDCYSKMSRSYTKLGILDLAQFYAEKALDLCKGRFEVSSSLTVSAFISLGDVYRAKSEYDRATSYYENALNIQIESGWGEDPSTARIHNRLGISHEENGIYHQAMEHYEMALKIDLNRLGPTHTQIANYYNNIGVIYRNLGALDLAQEYYLKTLNIDKINLGEDHVYIAGTHSNLGVVLKEKKAYDLAALHTQLAIDIYKKNYGEVHPRVALVYNNLGAIFIEANQNRKGLTNCSKAIEIYENLGSKWWVSVADAYDDMGLAYMQLGQYDSSEFYLRKSIEAAEDITGGRHPKQVPSFYYLAQVERERGNFEASMETIDLAIKYNLSIVVNGLSSDLQSFISPEFAIRSYKLQAENYRELFEQAENVEFLFNSKKSYSQALHLMNQWRSNMLSQSDKVKVGELTSQLVGGVAEVCYLLLQGAHYPSAIDEMFSFVESGKSGVLREALSYLSAKSVGFISDSTSRFEENLKFNQSLYRTKIQNSATQKEGYDTAKVRLWEDKLFQLNRSSDSLIDALEESYPRYHELKYQNRIITVEEVQEKIDDKTALLEYFVGDSAIFLFKITKNKYNIFRIPNDENLAEQIQNFRQNLESSVMGDQKTYKLMVSQAHQLYEKYLAIALMDVDKSINKLILIPDGPLSYIPFDILLTKAVGSEKVDYKGLPYLLKKYQTQYAYSATLLFNDFKQKERKANGNLLAFAPSYSDDLLDSVRSSTFGRFRDQVTSLKWNQPEVSSISEHIDGITFIGKDAVEKSFKDNSQDYNIIHLAMHALIDDEDPMNSKLVFTQETDSIEDNFLHAYELYNMELPAEMAVLSACQTGFGRLEKGEGVMSLARAFSYAGCPSVVMSHWSVNDASTSKLMNFFYKYLSLGKTKDEALQSAKLEYLNNADIAQSNPFYWGSFVVLGNTEPLNIQKLNNWYILGLLILVLLILVARRRMQVSHST